MPTLGSPGAPGFLQTCPLLSPPPHPTISTPAFCSPTPTPPHVPSASPQLLQVSMHLLPVVHLLQAQHVGAQPLNLLVKWGGRGKDGKHLVSRGRRKEGTCIALEGDEGKRRCRRGRIDTGRGGVEAGEDGRRAGAGQQEGTEAGGCRPVATQTYLQHEVPPGGPVQVLPAA